MCRLLEGCSQVPLTFVVILSCFSIFLTLVYRCLTTLLKQKKWLKSMSPLPLTFWSGLDDHIIIWTLANLPTHSLGFSSSFRRSNTYRTVRSPPSKMQIGMHYPSYSHRLLFSDSHMVSSQRKWMPFPSGLSYLFASESVLLRLLLQIVPTVSLFRRNVPLGHRINENPKKWCRSQFLLLEALGPTVFQNSIVSGF